MLWTKPSTHMQFLRDLSTLALVFPHGSDYSPNMTSWHHMTRSNSIHMCTRLLTFSLRSRRVSVSILSSVHTYIATGDLQWKPCKHPVVFVHVYTYIYVHVHTYFDPHLGCLSQQLCRCMWSVYVYTCTCILTLLPVCVFMYVQLCPDCFLQSTAGDHYSTYIYVCALKVTLCIYVPCTPVHLNATICTYMYMYMYIHVRMYMLPNPLS